MQTKKTKTCVLHLQSVDRELKIKFKAGCILQGKTTQQAIIDMMRKKLEQWNSN